MTCKELGNFEFDHEQGGTIPADVRQLNGVIVRLHGYMWPMEQENPLHQFALTPKLVYKEHSCEIILGSFSTPSSATARPNLSAT